MKKIVIALTIICVAALMCIGLVGCAPVVIPFTKETVKAQLNSAYSTLDGQSFQTVNSIDSCDSLKSFFDIDYFGLNTSQQFTMFDDDYFADNNLLVICYVGEDNERIVVTEINAKSEEMFVTIEVKKNDIKGKIQHIYRFLTVSKEDIKDITKFSYVIISV